MNPGFRPIVLLVFFWFAVSGKPAISQTSTLFLDADSLIALLPSIREDSAWLKTVYQISRTLNNINPSEAAVYNQQGFQKAKAIGSKHFMASFSNEVGLSHYFQGRLDSALFYFQKGISLYHSVGDTQNVQLLEANVGLILVEKGDYENAIKHYDELYVSARERKDSISMASYSGSIGLAYDYLGKYDVAMEYYHQALDLAKTIGYPSIVQINLSNIGALHSFLGEDDKAKSYFLQAIPLNIKYENLNELARNYQNLGIIYDYAEKNDSALYYHEKALAIYRKTNKKEGIADEYLNMGVVYEKLGQLDKAEDYYLKSLVLKEEVDSPERLSSIYIDLGSLYHKKKEYGKAEEYLKKAEKIALELGVIQRQKETYSILANVYESKGDYYHALDSYMKMKTASDSLLNESRVQAVADVEEKYKTKERIVENEKLKSEQAFHKAQLAKNRIALIAGGTFLVLLMLFTGFIIRYSRQLRTFNHLLENRNNQIQLLNREMNHRVKNNLAFMTGLLEMQGRRLENLDAREALKESESRLRALSLVHSSLFKEDGKQSLNIRQYLDQMLQNLQTIFEHPGKSLKITTDIAEMELPPEQTMRIGLIINELVTNSIKHAFAEVDEPEIDLRIYRNPERGLVLQYQDNGPGITEEVLEAKKDSLGLKLIGLLVEQLGGDMDMGSGSEPFRFCELSGVQ